jgi:glycosyltransferase involved in cell wall biosynthesis
MQSSVDARRSTSASTDRQCGAAVFILFWPVLAPRHELMMRSLATAGWSVRALAWDRGGSRYRPSGAPFDQWTWIEQRFGGWGPAALFSLARLYWKMWTRLRRGAPGEVVVITHLGLLGFTLLTKRRCVYDAMEMFTVDVPLHFPRLLRPAARIAIAATEGFLAARAALITTIDSREGWLERRYRRLGPPVEVFWNVPARADDPVDVVANPFPSDRKVVVYVGGLMPHQGLRIAIEAAARTSLAHPEVLFAFIGALKDDAAEVEQLIQSSGAGGHVTLLDRMGYREMLGYLKFAAVAIAPAQRARTAEHVSRGNGRKFFSYMQAGLPIVAPDFGEIGSLVAEVGCGVRTDTSDPNAIADAVIGLLEDPRLAQQLGRRGREAFENRFNWEADAPRFLAALESVGL